MVTVNRVLRRNQAELPIPRGCAFDQAMKYKMAGKTGLLNRFWYSQKGEGETPDIQPKSTQLRQRNGYQSRGSL
jgi:hypothetical protein